ncbi:MAG: hypothetical protein IKQ54_10100 [Oscillospiraceae bacterium]|nr:hypothetical protein [Oscillospiraceae bacterium]
MKKKQMAFLGLFNAFQMANPVISFSQQTRRRGEKGVKTERNGSPRDPKYLIEARIENHRRAAKADEKTQAGITGRAILLALVVSRGYPKGGRPLLAV